MEGNTHQLGGVTAGLVGCIMLSVADTQVANVSPLLAYPAIYVFSMVGSKLPDQDHNPKASPFKDPLGRSVSWLLHSTSKVRQRFKKGSVPYKLLGTGDSRHRSWQTHSDFTLYALIAVIWYFCFSGKITVTPEEEALIQVIVGGTALGVLSHLFLDAITPKGIWMLPGLVIYTLTGKKLIPMKFRLVPKRSFFATGNKWEELVNKALRVINWVLFIFLVILVLNYYFNLSDFLAR